MVNIFVPILETGELRVRDVNWLHGKSQLESGWALASVQFTRAQCLPNKPLKLSKPQYCHLTKILKIAEIIPLFTYDEAVQRLRACLNGKLYHHRVRCECNLLFSYTSITPVWIPLFWNKRGFFWFSLNYFQTDITCTRKKALCNTNIHKGSYTAICMVV